MHPAQKEQIMRPFRDHEFAVLVTTHVIAVGIDVPNATSSVIEGADRFGFAQTHQLRGRVGRRAYQRYCILVSNTDNEDSEKRMIQSCAPLDGVELARADVHARGPGAFSGDRQSGAGDVTVAKYWDWDTRAKAKNTARERRKQDPDFLQSKHRGIAKAYQRRWEHVNLSA